MFKNIIVKYPIPKGIRKEVVISSIGFRESGGNGFEGSICIICFLSLQDKQKRRRREGGIPKIAHEMLDFLELVTQKRPSAITELYSLISYVLHLFFIQYITRQAECSIEGRIKVLKIVSLTPGFQRYW